MSSNCNGAVKVIFGTMGIPSPMNKEIAREALNYFKSRGHNEIDTAIMYQAGLTEKVLGEMKLFPEFSIATKANPWFKNGKTHDDPVGGFEPSQLREQVTLSLKSLEISKIPLLYLHAPDHSTEIEETLKTLKEMKQEGLFDEWGLSNYASWQVVDIYHRCQKMGMATPSVYQGMYNPITREVEKELIPALRRCGMKFYAYNPLAGGILTGKWKFDDQPFQGRFNVNTVWGNRYRERYWKKSTFEELERVAELCSEYKCTLTSGTFRWMMNHGKLGAGDGVIIGGSSLDHMISNVDACEGDELPTPIVEAFERVWAAASQSCPSYFR